MLSYSLSETLKFLKHTHWHCTAFASPDRIILKHKSYKDEEVGHVPRLNYS